MAYEIKYRSDNEMKDSGIEWLGKIPKEWEVKKLKFVFSYFKGKNPDTFVDSGSGGIPYITTEYLRKGSTDYFVDSYKGLVKVFDDDILLLWDGANAGEFFDGKEGVLGSTFAKFNLISNNYKNYLKYCLRAFESYLKANTTGMGLPHVNSEILKSLLLNLPTNILDQQKIANFLDIKTAEFDTIISKKEKLIKKLEEAKKSLISEVITGKVKIVDGELVDRKPEEMKDSGVEWLGMIPRDWEVKKLKHLAVLNGRIGFRGYSKEDLVDEPEGALTIGATQVDENGNIDLTDPVYISWKKYYESPEIIIKQYDILLVQRGSTTGKIGIVNILPKEATINPSLIIIRSVQNIIHPKYLFYFLISYYTDAYFNSIISTTAIPMISQYQAMNTNILLPSLLHQKTIIQYLDNASNKIDSTITKTKQQITKLKEAKQSLISEAVTGKIDLRDWEIIETGGR